MSAFLGEYVTMSLVYAVNSMGSVMALTIESVLIPPPALVLEGYILKTISKVMSPHFVHFSHSFSTSLHFFSSSYGVLTQIFFTAELDISIQNADYPGMSMCS